MFCKNCGLEVSEDAKACPACHQPLASTDGQNFNDEHTSQPDSYNDFQADEFYNSSAQSQNSTYYDELDPKQPINNHLAWSILCTIFCCLPCGIVGIVYSSKVNSFIVQRRFKEAQLASKNAKIWNTVGTAIGVLSLIVIILVAVSGILISGSVFRFR